MTGIAKRFGATAALVGVDLELAPGEVHALIGENGAGKSTLMKVLAGVHAPDAGAMALDGAPYAPRGPGDARARGIAMIHQELMLCPHLDVAENIALGAEPARAGIVRVGARRALARAALDQLGVDIPLDAPVGALSPASRQLVEIARALSWGPRVLVMDEPTSSLTAREVDRLFTAVRRLAAGGVAVVSISHILEECRALCRRFTVLRDGATVAGGELATVDDAALIAAMVGRPVTDIYPRSPRTPGVAALALRGVSGADKPRAVDLVVHHGEVVGLFGLVGAGRTELARAVFGLDRMRAGRVAIGAAEDSGAAPHRRWAQGVGLVSEDRKGEGLALGLAIADNLCLTRLGAHATAGCISDRRLDAATTALMRRLDVRASGPTQAVGELSGGNQQKVAVARLLHHGAGILILDEPCRGIDVGAKAVIYALIDELARAGAAILLISSYIPELLGVCDRIAVMRRGTLDAARTVGEWDERSLLSAAIR